jgi:hypothetical protein
MSTVLDLDDARALGIPLPADDTLAQAALDQVEAEMERILGPLTGSRTETFYTGGTTTGKLSLGRYTDAVAVVDNGVTVATGQFRLIDKGSAIARDYNAASWWWNGPYVTATYEPNDLLEVTAVGYQVLALSATPEMAAGALQAETIGSYSYSKAGGTQSPQGSLAARRSLIKSLLPKRDTLLNVRPTRVDYPTRADVAQQVVNLSEPPL